MSTTQGGIEIYNPSTYQATLAGPIDHTNNTDGVQTQQMGTYEYAQEAETEDYSENIMNGRQNDKNAAAQTTIEYLQKEIEKYQA